MAKEIDYKRFEVNYKFFHMSYTHQKEKYAGGMGSRNKVITRLFKVFDILLSLLSSILSILKSIFVTDYFLLFGVIHRQDRRNFVA